MKNPECPFSIDQHLYAACVRIPCTYVSIACIRGSAQCVLGDEWVMWAWWWVGLIGECLVSFDSVSFFSNRSWLFFFNSFYTRSRTTVEHFTCHMHLLNGFVI